jgi:hypothetical protein
MDIQQSRAKRILLLAAVVVLLSSSVAHAQWVFVARKALQVINSVAGQVQSPSSGQGQGPSVDAANVLLEADADKVYAVAVKLARENPEVQVLWQDDPRRAIAFSRGEQSVSLKVSRLGDNLSQILVAATYGKPGGTSLVVEAILRVCHQMGVECSHAQD